MNYYESKMEMALAEILGVNFETVDMLNLSIEPNVGHDDFFYGYYVEFPNKNNINEDVLASREQCDIDKIPWGETEYYTEAQFANTSVDPFGYKAEWEENFYSEAFFSSDEEVLQKLEEIKKILNTNTNTEIIVKSLILSVFSITEGYMRAIVYREIPDVEVFGLDDKLKVILQKDLSYKLSNNKTRIELYKELTGKKLKSIPYYKEVRNPLAHNILSAKILKGDIIINDGNRNLNYCINDILNELKDYINSPIETR